MNDRCEIASRLAAYMDGEVDERERRAIEAHLSSCAACAASLDAMRAADRVLRDAIREETEPARETAHLEQVLHAIREEPVPDWAIAAPVGRRPDRRRFNLWPSVRWAAGLAVGAAAVLLVLRLGPYPLAPERPRSVPVPVEEKAAAEPSGEATVATAPEAADAAVEAPRQAPVAEASPEPPPVEPAPAPAPAPVPSEPFAMRVRPGPAPAEELAGSPAPAREETWGRTDTKPVRRREPSTIKALRDAAAPPAGSGMERHLIDPSLTFRGLRGGVTPQGSALGPASIDTSGSTAGWPERLDGWSRALLSASSDTLELAEQARQWRQIGDLWSWIDRREDSREARAKAHDAYLRALALEADSTAAEPPRVRRRQR